ncbi:MAG: glycosyltransferase [bacterium]|nr:glycosyltransferase [bacterium]
MKILCFIDGLRAGGKERQLVALLKGLAHREGFEPAVAVMHEDVHYKEIGELGIPIYYLIRKSKRDFSIFSQVSALIKEFKPDVIHVWDYMTALYALPAARMKGVKLVNGAIRHAARPRPFSKFHLISKLTFAFSHRVVSNSMAGLFANGLEVTNKHRCIVNGFDLERMKNLLPGKEIRERFDVTTPKVAGMVAGFEDRKDYKLLVEAAGKIVDQRDDITFMAVGDGKNFKKIKDLVKKEHQEKIKLVGRQSDVESIVNIFDIGLLVNNTHGHAEGISNSIMEYMALGKPVIASDSGGSKEIVQQGTTGYIVEPFDLDALTGRILELLDDKEKAEEMGKLGKTRIKEEFSFAKMIDRYCELYKGVASGGQGEAPLGTPMAPSGQ